MQILISAARRVEKFLRRQVKNKAYQFSDAPDPRQTGKVLHSIDSIIRALLGGLLENRPTLRALESHTGTAAPLGSAKKISDTTLHGMLPRLDEAYLQDKLVAQVKHMHRKKMLKGADLPVNVIAIDGKNLGMLKHDGTGKGHHRSSASAKKWGTKTPAEGHWLAPVLRAVLVSAQSRPIMMQMPIAAGTGESTLFGEFFGQLVSSYSRTELVDVVTMDAGLCSLDNADLVEQAGITYVFGLKDNQPLLYEAAQRLLCEKAAMSAPEAQTSWERRNGKQIRRQLWRTRQMANFETTPGVWSHLRQTWLIRQTTRDVEGTDTLEDRYFITNMQIGKLNPSSMLKLIRAHWRIENDAFNSLDLQWKEDLGPWCRTGASLWTLSLLRCMAYNLAQHLRRCHLRKKQGTLTQMAILPWSDVFAAIVLMVTTIELHASVFVT